MGYKILSFLIALIVFIAGSFMIVYYGRPVMKPENVSSGTSTSELSSDKIKIAEPISDKTVEKDISSKTNAPTTDATKTGSSSNTNAGIYTMAVVEKHHSQNDCWAVVNTSVYDLTSWINRHPGGPSAIIRLCGTDATALFSQVHGRSSVAKHYLALLKIGNLEK